jgi:hypothetical protein
MEYETNVLTQQEARARIEHEDNVINHRVSWLIGSQAFLLTAFVLLRNNPAYYAPDTRQAHDYLRSTHLLVFAIATIGAVVALCTSMGIFAAFTAIRCWRERVPDLDQRHQLMPEYWIARLAGLAALLPGPVLLSIWTVLFLSEWPGFRAYLSTRDVGIPAAAAAATFVAWLLYVRVMYFGAARRRFGRPA